MSQRNSRSYIYLFASLTVVGVLLVYVYIQARTFLNGPILTIESPQNGTHITTAVDEITILGTASHISFLTLNGAQIYVDNEGRFARPISLLPGHNVVTLEGTDKFNRVRRVSLQLTYDPDAIRFQ